MAFKPVNEHAGEDRTRGRVPKFLKLKNGALVPYNKNVAAHKNNGTGFKKGVEAEAPIPLFAMPADHAEGLKERIAARDAQERAQAELQAQSQVQMDAVRKKTLAGVKAGQAKIKIGQEEKAAQNTVASATEPTDFVISDASADELVEFAKTNLHVDLDPAADVEVLRAEVAKLAGVEQK